MKLLAIDTSFPSCSIALQNDAKIFSHHQFAPMQHTKLALPIIKALLLEAQLSVSDLEAIVIAIGPGSFTGIRIASALAQGLSLPAKIPLPIIEVSSLAALAKAAYQATHHTHWIVAVEAQKNSVYFAMYECQEEEMITLKPEILININELPLEQLPNNGYGVGDGFQKYPSLAALFSLEQKIHPHPEQLNTAKALLTLGIPKFKNKEWTDASTLTPLYLR